MAVFAGTKIVDDGLVFHYDMENITKSFKGKPTTNIISSQGISGAQGITYTYVTDEDGWKKYSISGTWASGTYPWSCRINNATFTGGVAYSSRFLIKTNVREKYATFPDTTVGLHYVNDGNMTNGGTKTSNFLGYDKDGLEIIDVRNDGFIYSTGFANPTTTQVGYFHSRPLADGTSFNSNTDFIWVKEIQVEENSFATPYVENSRSNTEALIDLTGNNTITANSLTYNSDGTFSFNGSNNLITFPENSSLNTQTPTVEVWAKTNATNQNGFWFEKGNVNTQYSLFQQNNSIIWRAYINSGFVNMISITTASYINTTDWFHIVATFESGQQYVYINGVQVGSRSLTGTIATNANGCSIGAYGGFSGSRGYYYNGDIGSVKVYDRVLTADEVLNNFEATRGRYGT